MKLFFRCLRPLAFKLAWLGCLLISTTLHADSASWLSFRGDGTSSGDRAPTVLVLGGDETSETSSNLAWRQSMPGRSVATPIVVDHLVVSTSSSGPDESNLYVTACSLESGNVVWQHCFRATGRPFHHPTGSVSAPSPVSDGKSIVAFFSSNDLVCLSLAGELLWYRGLGSDYPKSGNDVGMASSPTIVDDAVIVQVECQGDSYAAAIEMSNGKNRWRVPRPRRANWSSPTAISLASEHTQVILQSGEDIVALDPKNGTELWRIDEGRSTIPSATHKSNVVLLPGDDLMALKIKHGEEPETLWRENKLSPRNSCVAIDRDRVYVLKGSVLVAANLNDGQKFWQKRLSGLGGTWASPIVANGHVYLFDQSGVGLVIKDNGDDAEEVNRVALGEGVLGSPVIADGRLIVRSQTNLFCFE